jgi:MFS family permease
VNTTRETSLWSRYLGLSQTAGRRGLVAAMAVDSLGSGLFLPFGILYFLRATDLPLAVVGGSLTAAQLLTLFFPLALAPLIDRWGPKNVVVIGNIISACSYAGYVFVDNQPELLLAALAASIGNVTFWTATRALIGQVIEPGGRRGWFALQTAVRNAGYGVGGLLGAVAVGFNGLTTLHAIVIADALSFAAAATLFWRWRAAPPAGATGAPTAAPDTAAQRKTSYRTILTDPSWWSVIGVNLVFVLCSITLDVLLAVYLVKDLHQPAWLAGLLYALNTFLIVAAQTMITSRTRDQPTARVLYVGALGWIASFTLLWALLIMPRAAAPPVLVVAVVIYTAAQLLQGPAINALAVDLAPRDAPGRHMAVFQLSWNAGISLAPAILTGLLTLGAGWPWIMLIALCGVTAAGLTTSTTRAKTAKKTAEQAARAR